eukprot:CAMPEP_0117677418 /NCGR_PEP_ID=MMETSP0804-20121206/16734_1 /TAXON_ID=1074897 /ORGANISM="Tetraselmis astigmatica, Strain CCMP880" /LENGTH=175 /DNA_ID=CAMNT_0005486699 /DNA_START=405 /DNA_END=933 /DNA_ORIENTATION=+
MGVPRCHRRNATVAELENLDLLARLSLDESQNLEARPERGELTASSSFVAAPPSCQTSQLFAPDVPASQEPSPHGWDLGDASPVLASRETATSLFPELHVQSLRSRICARRWRRRFKVGKDLTQLQDEFAGASGCLCVRELSRRMQAAAVSTNIQIMSARISDVGLERLRRPSSP